MLDIPHRRHVLDNGLTVILSEDRTVPVVGVNLWYGVGSRNERKGRTGFAHLFEHMMFQGSAHVPKGRHFELVERAGGSLNASTWFDRTNYFESVPSHHLDLALWLESDRMGWMVEAMTQEKLDNQRDVVKNERRQRYDNQPYGDWDERLLALVFPEDHPYRHSVIGTMEDIEAATLDDVADFFRTFYVPNNAVLTICGDFDDGPALESVRTYFGEIPKGDPVPPIPGRVEIPARIGETVRATARGAVPLPRVYVATRVPTLASPEFQTAEVAGAVLGTGRASRLYRSLVREQGVARDVVSFVFPLLSGSSMMLTWATGYADSTPEALEAALVAELERMARVDRQEVDRAVAVAVTRLVRGVQQVGERADLLSMFELSLGDAGRLNEEIDRMRAVTPDDVGDFAERWFGPDNRAVLTYLPEEPAAPEEPA
jgi:zinc protease